MNDQKETELLDLLAHAIYDVGLWSWWASELPDKFQVEFRGTQLYFSETDESKRPSSQIAIQFRNLKSVSFLTRQSYPIEMADNWPDQLHQDQIKPFSCEHGAFTFIDSELMNKMIGEAKIIKTIHGYSPKDNAFQNERVRLVFWAQNAGFAIAADEMRLIDNDGWVELKDIPDINRKWWDYWRKYWEMKNAGTPLPTDYGCEVTIPIKAN